MHESKDLNYFETKVKEAQEWITQGQRADAVTQEEYNRLSGIAKDFDRYNILFKDIKNMLNNCADPLLDKLNKEFISLESKKQENILTCPECETKLQYNSLKKELVKARKPFPDLKNLLIAVRKKLDSQSKRVTVLREDKYKMMELSINGYCPYYYRRVENTHQSQYGVNCASVSNRCITRTNTISCCSVPSDTGRDYSRMEQQRTKSEAGLYHRGLCETC